MRRIVQALFLSLYVVILTNAHESSPFYQVNRLPSLEEIHSRPLYYFEFLNHFRLNSELLPPQIQLPISAFNRSFVLDLALNDDILHDNIELTIDGQGHSVAHYMSQFMDDVRRRIYTGHVRNSGHPEPIGWARIVFHTPKQSPSNDHQWEFEGTFMADAELHLIRLADHYENTRRPIDIPVPGVHERKHEIRNAPMIIYREVDRHQPSSLFPKNRLLKRELKSPNEHVCGADDLEANVNPLNGAEAFFQELLKKYLDNQLDLPRLEKRSAQGCPTTKKIVYMGVAADCTYVAHYGDPAKAVTQIMLNWNQASQLFENTFNIALGITQLNIMTTCSTADGQLWNRDCGGSYTISNRLNDFSKWRGAKPADNAGLWHLMTKCSSGPTVGIAWTNTLCRTNITQVSNNGITELRTGAGVSSVNVNEWMVVAHEIGHNFGAQHDCTASSCPCREGNCSCCACESSCDCQNKFIMNPTANIQNAQFSPCTINQICSKIPVLGTCLSDIGKLQTLSANQCGNGVKEGDEQCDCGDPNGEKCKNDPCCDGATCKLKGSAQCSDSNDQCCSGCKIRSAGFVCRDKRSSCDNAEVCDGKSATCPKDSVLEDGSPCGGKSTYCASGQCTNRDLQCQAIGQSQNISKSCGDYHSQCSLFCASAISGKCQSFSGFFLDGTECGNNGRCVQGFCETALTRFFTPANIAWVVIVGLVLIGGIFGLLFWCRRRRNSNTRAKKNSPLLRIQQRQQRVLSTDAFETIPNFGFMDENTAVSNPLSGDIADEQVQNSFNAVVSKRASQAHVTKTRRRSAVKEDIGKEMTIRDSLEIRRGQIQSSQLQPMDLDELMDQLSAVPDVRSNAEENVSFSDGDEMDISSTVTEYYNNRYDGYSNMKTRTKTDPSSILAYHLAIEPNEKVSKQQAILNPYPAKTAKPGIRLSNLLSPIDLPTFSPISPIGDSLARLSSVHGRKQERNRFISHLDEEDFIDSEE